jgi:hypothetical protein
MQSAPNLSHTDWVYNLQLGETDEQPLDTESERELFTVVVLLDKDMTLLPLSEPSRLPAPEHVILPKKPAPGVNII